MSGPADAAEGLLVVDKPAGLTSHDVVARARRLLGTRRVGHAGTLDPMATGVLVLGVGRATRLLGHLAGHDKEYLATVRLGLTTSSDDAQGEPLRMADPALVVAVRSEDVAGALAALRGAQLQVPPAVSAIKVAGRRAYARVRAGEQVELAARPVVVHELELLARRGEELDLRVCCSAGTYVRSLARDLGAALGVGAHLSALRRTRSGPFDQPVALPDPGSALPTLLGLDQAVGTLFPVRQVSGPDLDDIRHGRPLPPGGAGPHPVGVFDPDGRVLALVADRDGRARPLVVFAPA